MQLTKLTRAETDLTEVNVKLLSSQEKCARFDEELKAKVSLQSFFKFPFLLLPSIVYLYHHTQYS